MKLRTVRTLLWITLGMVALVVIPVVSVVASSGEISTAADDRTVARIAAIAVIFALLLGIIVAGAEGTHGTITQTFLVAPARERVLAAKAIVAVVLGVVLGILAEGLTVLIAVPGASLNLHNARLVLVGVVVACAVAGASGAGLGALFHREGPAIVVALLWLLIAENVLTIALHNDVKYLPGHVFAATVAGTRGSSQDDLLGTWPGALGAALYAVGFLVAGGALLSRRDV
jgi:ABC-type transport system involved in multi-copper enzyme maturation permease subunit